MKRVSLFLAAAIVLVANVSALAHARTNRSGRVEADITLTERELARSYNSNNEDSGVTLDDIGVTLNLRWNDPRRIGERQSPWLDRKILGDIGFNITVSPSDDAAQDFYRRQRPRRAFVALEYDGPAWRNSMDDLERQTREHPELFDPNFSMNQRESATRLMVIDASGSASRLRIAHPDRGSIIIVPAVIRIEVDPFYVPGQARGPTPPRLVGVIQDIPSSIHVPLPFSRGFRNLPADRNSAKYNVHLRYGVSLEPWVAGVEFSPTDKR